MTGAHQSGSLRVLHVDLLSLIHQLLHVSQHPPLCSGSCLVDHLLGDACQSNAQAEPQLKSQGGAFSS